MPRKRHQYKLYSVEEKRKAIKLHEEDKYSIKAIAAMMGMSYDNSITRWLAEYKEYGDSAFTINKKLKRVGRRRIKFDSMEEKIAYLEAENAILRELVDKKKVFSK